MTAYETYITNRLTELEIKISILEQNRDVLVKCVNEVEAGLTQKVNEIIDAVNKKFTEVGRLNELFNLEFTDPLNSVPARQNNGNPLC